MILSYLASRRRQRQAAIPALAHITPSPWRQGWRQLRRNRLAMFCLILLAVMACWGPSGRRGVMMPPTP